MMCFPNSSMHMSPLYVLYHSDLCRRAGEGTRFMDKHQMYTNHRAIIHSEPRASNLHTQRLPARRPAECIQKRETVPPFPRSRERRHRVIISCLLTAIPLTPPELHQLSRCIALKKGACGSSGCGCGLRLSAVQANETWFVAVDAVEFFLVAVDVLGCQVFVFLEKEQS